MNVNTALVFSYAKKSSYPLTLLSKRILVKPNGKKKLTDFLVFFFLKIEIERKTTRQNRISQGKKVELCWEVDWVFQIDFLESLEIYVAENIEQFAVFVGNNNNKARRNFIIPDYIIVLLRKNLIFSQKKAKLEKQRIRVL